MTDNLLRLFHLASACGTNTGILPSLWDPGRLSGGASLTCVNGEPTITNVLGVLIVLGNLTRILISLSGGIAILMIIVGGVFWVISGGDPARIKTGRDIMANSVVGLVIIIVAYAVITFIVNGF